jgi:hypothetical protein
MFYVFITPNQQNYSSCANETEKRKKIAECEKDARQGSFSKGAVSVAD